MTPTGINLFKNKVDGIMAIALPITLRRLRGFIGMVKYYRGFWRQRSDIMSHLKTLTKVTTKYFHINWKPEHLNCFNNVE